MTFKRIWPWLLGLVILVLVVAGAFFARMWFFGSRLAAPMMGRLPQGNFHRGFGGGGPGFGGPMMGGGWGGHMGGGFGLFGGLGMILGPIFLVGLFLFTVWALLKIVRGTMGAPAHAMTRACPNCGRAAAADWNTCPYCGTDLNKSVPPPSEPAA